MKMNAKTFTVAGLTAAALLFSTAVAPATAQTTVTPFAGATFEGDAPESQLSTGVSLAFMGDFAGVELELGYTPDFYAQGGDNELVLVGESNVTTLMGNAMFGYQRGILRPYAAIGVGLLRSNVDGGDFFDDVNENDFGMNAGVGLMGMFSEHIGVRGDVRYFRSFTGDDDSDVELSLGDFDFWRAYAGLTFEF
jgi:opacity protein-like surface antigen